jgi:hypothetical protein
MDRCETCDEWLFAFSTRAHACAPKWRVRDEDSGGDYLDNEVHAADAESAAEKAVDTYFWEEPSDNLPEGYVCIVEPVGPPENEERILTRVTVSGEHTVAWSTETLKPDASPLPCPKCARPASDHSEEGRTGRRYYCEHCSHRWEP